MRMIRQVIFLFAACICFVIALFWVWFLYTYSLQWGWDAAGNPLQVGTAVVYGRQGAIWIGSVTVGWFLLAVFFLYLHWRQQRQLRS